MTKFYQGTPEQALAYAEDISRKFNEHKVESEKYETIDDAMTNLVSEIDSLENTLRYQSRDNLLEAIYQFAYIQQALEIVRIKVEQAYDVDDEEEEAA
jgi:hypothetical protein